MLQSQKVMKALEPARKNLKYIGKFLRYIRKVSNTSRGVSNIIGKDWSLSGKIQNREEREFHIHEEASQTDLEVCQNSKERL